MKNIFRKKMWDPDCSLSVYEFTYLVNQKSWVPGIYKSLHGKYGFPR